MKVAIVIPNLNGGADLLDAVGSLRRQVGDPVVVVVDNDSSDDSVERLMATFPEVVLLRNPANLGFSGGVNCGIRWGLENNFDAIGVFNDDAVAQPGWLIALTSLLEVDDRVAAVTSKVLTADGRRFDSAGDLLTTWGLGVPRGRGVEDQGQYEVSGPVFGASGAASLFRAGALREVGLFDEDFFAYFEDVDLSLRLRVAGWEILYCPKAVVHHVMGMTSSRTHGFVTHQTMKNAPLVLFKSLPYRVLFRILPRFLLAQVLLTAWAFSAKQGEAAMRGHAAAIRLIWAKRAERAEIVGHRKLTNQEIRNLLSDELPPNRRDLRVARRAGRLLTLKREGG